ncbi:MAG: TIGR03668 family PPOX class F420-dependent oxidoreductase [Actinomycetota bacterium]|nr:TIGR03668 family PPOX class F420-dependent oxidoreductase [Actinomycetota bacterium]
MRRDADWARARFAEARVARLATVSGDGSPHLVPIVFAVAGNRLLSAVDQKPKSTTALRRLDNIAVNPFVCVLVDGYDDDWAQLWWARADGWARVLPREDVAEFDTLTSRYAQYRDQPPRGLVIVVEVDAWTGWSAR